jgi:hypothetical protein
MVRVEPCIPTHWPAYDVVDRNRSAAYKSGLSGARLQKEASTVLGTFMTLESIAYGFRSGLRFLSLMMLIISLVVAILLARRPGNCERRLRPATPDE